MVCDCCCVSTIVYAAGLFTIAHFLFPIIKKLVKKDSHELLEKNYKKDTVYLYQFPGNATLSSFSPFCIKVEAFLRLHNIKFERRDTMSARGANGLLPYVELNGQGYSDSQIIMRRIAEQLEIKEFSNDEQASYSRVIERMADTHTFCALLFYKSRSVAPMIDAFRSQVPAALFPLIQPLAVLFFGRKMRSKVAATIGKFTEQEHVELLRADLSALQSILGSKQFLLGEKPCAADCTVFGQLASVYYMAPAKHSFVVDLLDSDDYAPLKTWMVRVRDTAFKGEFHA